MRVLLTGATGYIAGQLLPALRERYDLKLLDVREADGSGRRVEGIEVADLLGEDGPRLEELLANVDVVVWHLICEIGDPSVESSCEKSC